jgi:DNA-binding PadR family transcriptional regulator
VRHLILGLLAKGPSHGYELKAAIDRALGRLSPPLNIGQIYTTLRRHERDGLVSAKSVDQAERPQKRVYSLTAAGHEELATWLAATEVEVRIRDSFFLKLIAAESSRLADPIELIDRQRRALLRRLRAVQRGGEGTTATERMAVEGAVLHLQADLRWLEICEQLLIEESA